MATKTISKWTPYGVALDITATTGTVTRTAANKYTVVINVSWETYYDGAKTNYGMSAASGGVTKVISAFGTSRSSGSAQFTGTYSISGNGSAAKSITVTFKNFNTDKNQEASKDISLSITVPAWTSYTVVYNANGGTGAPSSQTKTYGKTLTLSSTKPTRTNYNFKGWGTSASATTVAYASGASYTANAATTLYAIWELAYTKPRITGYSVTRCNSNGVADANGTYALVKFNWACDKTVSSIIVTWAVPDVPGTQDTEQLSVSGTSGSVNEIISSGNLSAEYTYTVRVSVTDAGGSTSKDKPLNGNNFLIDCLPENKGIAFGKPAEKEGYADFKFKTQHRDNAEFINDKAIYGTDTDGTVYNALIPVTASGNTSLGHGLYKAEKGKTHIYGNEVHFYTKNGIRVNGNDIYMNK